MNPEVLRHIELLTGSIGVILGVFFSLFLYVTRQNQHKANIFLSIYLLAFSLRIGKSLFHNYFEIDPTIRVFFLTTLLCVGPSVWLYTYYLSQSKAKSNIKDSIHFLPFIIIVCVCWLIPNNGTSVLFAVFYDFLILHMFCYTLFSLIWIYQHKRNVVDTKENKTENWLKLFISINIIFICVYFLISESIIPFYIGISFLFSIVIIFLSFWALKHPFLFRIPLEKYKHSTIDSNQVFRLMTKLKTYMDQEKPYIDPSLTLVKLSDQLEVSSKELSQAINQTEALNYSQFIAKYRVEEVQRLLATDASTKLTIAAIAYDSGFSSISSFNAAFKKHTHMTAIAYRKSLEA